MKMKKVLILALFLFCFNSYFASECELWFHIKDANGNAYNQSISVALYKVIAGNSISNMVLKHIANSYSLPNVWNGVRMEMINTGSTGICDTATFSENLGVDGTHYYCLVFRGVDIFFFYVGDVEDANGDDGFIYQVDSNSVWTFSQSYYGRTPSTNAQYEYGSWSPKALTLSNDFSGGNMVIDNVTVSIPGSSNTFYTSTNSSHNIQAISPQDYGGYTRYFNYWNSNTQDISSSKSVTMNDNYTHQAKFYHYSDLDLYTSFEGTVQNGYFLVGGLTTNTYTSISKKSSDNLTFTSQNQEKNSLIYTFDSWKKNGNVISTSSTYTFPPTENATYTLNLKPLKPSNTYRNQAFRNPDNSSPTPGSNIRINWSTHPDNRVDGYKIWRRVKHNGVVGDSVLLSTVGSSTTYYIDYDYAYTDGYTDDIVYYDVRARLYYNSNYSYPDALYEAAFGELAPLIEQNDKPISSIVEEVPTEYSITNYPNPFNPTTTINYQLPENGFVTIKVYDMLGKEVAVLVNETKSAGYYKVDFNASKLTSGVYVYTIQVNNPSAGSGRSFVQSKKMLLMK
jgi:hypothetical protein